MNTCKFSFCLCLNNIQTITRGILFKYFTRSNWEKAAFSVLSAGRSRAEEIRLRGTSRILVLAPKSRRKHAVNFQNCPNSDGSQNAPHPLSHWLRVGDSVFRLAVSELQTFCRRTRQRAVPVKTQGILVRTAFSRPRSSERSFLFVFGLSFVLPIFCTFFSGASAAFLWKRL